MPQAKKILLVEDDEDLSDILNIKFSNAGFEVLKAVNGYKAIELAKKQMPDFIILDILLPEIDGYTVLTELQANEKTKQIPLVILTNLDSQDSIEHVRNVGEFEYFIKTKTDFNDLVEGVKYRLGVK